MALNTGFPRARELQAQIVVTLDGDGQHDPLETPRVVFPIFCDQADMVIGSRFLEVHDHIPLWRQVGQRVLTWVTNASSGVACSDSQSGFRALGPHALEALTFRSPGFAAESEMQFCAHEHHLRVVEVPASCVYAEKPKRNPVRQGTQVLNVILELVSQSRPLLILGGVGLLLALLGTAGWCWIVGMHNQAGDLRLGYALVATLAIILGVLSAFEGITLHTIRRLNRRPTRPPARKKGDKAK